MDGLSWDCRQVCEDETTEDQNQLSEHMDFIGVKMQDFNLIQYPLDGLLKLVNDLGE